MNLLHIFYTSLGSAVVLFILTKLMGNREMSQLSMFDFIIGITIGSIAAEMATEIEEFMKPLVAMMVYAVLSVLISYINCKSMVARRFFTGKSLILMEDGKIYNKNLMKAKLDVNEFLMQCRNQGYFNIDSIHSAILEPNGRISLLPKSSKRYATPEDLKIMPDEEKPIINLIIDGKILKENLRCTGKDEKWLQEQVNKQGISNLSDVFLATCDHKHNINLYIKINKKFTHDIFQ
jgi:uncharacterized membrane protein YcaP (DUF421 family)